MNKVFFHYRENSRVSGFSVKNRRFFVLAVFLIVPAFWAPAEEAKDFVIGIPVEVNMYSRSSVGFGGGFFLGLEGDGAALGIRTLYSRDPDDFRSLEVTLFLRLYLPEISGNSGFFAQLNVGPALFWEEDNEDRGVFCAGLGLGWRHFLDERWFVEPSVRAGYPFVFGVGIAAGIRL
jgi:hypothetical protein